MNEFGRWAVGSVFALALASMPAPLLGAPGQKQEWNLERQDLDGALRAIGRSSRREIIFRPEAVKGRQAPPLNGIYTALEAVETVLRGTRLTAVERDGTILIRRRFSAASDDALTSGENIVVTGSRIRGGAAISPVVSISKDEAQRSGQNNLGEVIRDLPQNYSGGQNPTVAGTGQGDSFNTSGSSAINLRGLGPDATLTLFNGHRVAFDAVSQGVDISAIPLVAIERIDIVTDGASALYGSDAIGGVANVILRRAYDGLFTSARLGAATSGGAVTQQYDVVGGHQWQSGGVMLASDFQRSTGITAGQRSYTNNQYRTATLIQPLKQFSIVGAGYQSLSDNFSIELDGHYLRRSTSQCTPTTATADCGYQGNIVAVDVESFSVSPALNLTLDNRWNARFAGTYSKSDSKLVTHAHAAGVETTVVRPNYINDLKSGEIGAEGPLFALPGGEVRLAIGGGYRATGLSVDMRRYRNGLETPVNVFQQSRKVLFGYAELFLPVLARDNNFPGVEKLELQAAVRYEDHKHIDRIFTPKLGLLYSPLDGAELAVSWGKSFKAPTLYQTGQTSNAQLVAATTFTPAPASMLPVLYLYGGNVDLKPERATTWSISGKYTPRFAEGLDLHINYFSIKYRDRVTEPIISVGGAFQAINSNFVQVNPTEQQVLEAIAGLSGAFTNLTIGSFDPNAVSAIVYNQLQNVSIENAQGVDFSARYQRGTPTEGQITANATASYLDSERQVTQSLPSQPLSGIIFNPPHWRGRLNLSWEQNGITLTGIGSYIGGTVDNRLAPTVRVKPFASFDAIARIRTSVEHGILANLVWTIAIQNLLNEKPSYIRTTNPIGLRFDSTNYPTTGRAVSFTLSKEW
ncbi:TonB-dependent receptor [Sphingobium cupriresistens]|nr:TonB-dependent receptor [Sphingobium cupriresistens]